MALVYNNVRPLDISYNGTQINELKYNEQGVWGRPFSLSITKTTQVTVNVNRTSSPNQGAELGNLSDGSTLYYGDVLVITYSIDSGYKVNAHSINGQNLNSGQSVTVTEALEIVVTAMESYSWHTIWSGSKYITTNTLITTSSRLPLEFRLTLSTLNETWQEYWDQTVTCEVDKKVDVYGVYDGIREYCGQISVSIEMDGLNVKIKATFWDRTGGDTGDPYTMTISKLEGYY